MVYVLKDITEALTIIHPTDYRLMINGLVDREMIFTLNDLKSISSKVNKFYFLECATNGGMEWRGAHLNGCPYRWNGS